MSLSFNELDKALSEAPATWVPALLKTLVQRSVTQKVFKPGGLGRLVESAANALRDEAQS